MKHFLSFLSLTSANLFENHSVQTRISKQPGRGRNNFGISRLQCLYHPRWINCRSKASMQLRPAPGKAVPLCVGGCAHGTCVKKCLFGECHNRCECDAGWEGLRCNKDQNDCRRMPDGSRPCEHRCVNLEGKRRCLCEEGFELQADGRSCKRTKSLCQLKGCELDCFERYGVAHCTCPKPGYKLGPDGKSCEDENECMTKGIGLCRTTEVCVNLRGGYRCDCAKGYIRNGGSPLCEDIDECAMGVHDCDENQACRNIDGFYQCIANTNIPFQAERASLRAPLLMRNPNSERPEIIDDNSEYDYNDAKYSGSSYDYENADDMKNSVPYYE